MRSFRLLLLAAVVASVANCSSAPTYAADWEMLGSR